MTDPATLALYFAAGAAVAWRFTALHYRDRLREEARSSALYRAWWERDSARAITAEAELDLRRQRHIDAGRQSHKAERALFRETAERIASLPAQPLRPRHEIEAEVAAIRAARRNKPLDGAGRGVLPASSPARGGFDCPAPLSMKGA